MGDCYTRLTISALGVDRIGHSPNIRKRTAAIYNIKIGVEQNGHSLNALLVEIFLNSDQQSDEGFEIVLSGLGLSQPTQG